MRKSFLRFLQHSSFAAFLKENCILLLFKLIYFSPCPTPPKSPLPMITTDYSENDGGGADILIPTNTERGSTATLTHSTKGHQTGEMSNTDTSRATTPATTSARSITTYSSFSFPFFDGRFQHDQRRHQQQQQDLWLQQFAEAALKSSRSNC